MLYKTQSGGGDGISIKQFVSFDDGWGAGTTPTLAAI